MADEIKWVMTLDNKGAMKNLKQFRGEVEETPKATKKASEGISRMTKALGALAVTFATVKVAQFFRESVQAASEQERVFQGLAVAMKNAGVSYNDVGREVQSMLGHLQKTTRYGDTDTAQVLQRLTSITGNYDAALKLLNPTLDFATAMQIDLASAARLAGQAATGMTGTLSRYGVILSDTVKEQLANADAMERAEIMARELNQRFGGAAQADLQTYAGRIQQVSNYWGDFQEVLGDVVVKTSAAPGVMEKLQSSIETMTSYAKDFGEVVVFIANYDFSTALDAYTKKAAAVWLRFFASVNEQLAKLPTWMGGGDDRLNTAEVQRIAADLFDAFAEMNLDGIFNDASDAALAFRDAVDNVTVSASGLAGAIEDVGDESKETATEATAAAAEVERSFLAAGSNIIKAYDANGRLIAGSFEYWLKQGAEKAAVAVDTELTTSFDETAGVLESTFSDLLGKGFMGELDSFRDLWDEVWQDLAKSMVGILGDAFTSAFQSSGSYNPTGAGAMLGGLQNIGDWLKQNKLAAGIGGAGMIYGGYQQGGGGGMLQGAIGGAMAGFAFGGVPGAIAGAIAGAVLASFGSDKTPFTGASISLRPGDFASGQPGSWLNTEHQGMSSEAQDLWITARQQEFRSSINAYRDILRIFNESDLFELIGETPDFNFAGAGGADAVATIFREQWLPEAMRQMFEGAINQGLGDLGMSDQSIQQLWDELGQMVGSAQIPALQQFVSSLVGITNLYDDMSWDSIVDASRMDSMTSFMEGLSDISDAVSTQMLGLDSMTLLERAQQAQNIEQLVVQARQAEIQMLRQLDSLQKGINQSLASQIEGIELGGMTNDEKQRYYYKQITSIMATLRSGNVTSPEQLQQLIADLQRYTSGYEGTWGDDFYTTFRNSEFGYNFNPADFITSILGEAGGLSDDLFEGWRGDIQASNQALIEQLELLITALTDVEGVFGDPKTYSPEVTVPVEVNVNIEGDKSLFIREVRSIVWAEMRRAAGAASAGNNAHGVN